MHLPGELDWRVLALSAGVCLLATASTGLVPALQTRNLDLAGALKADSAGVVGGGRRAWVRSGLVLVQVALSFVLLVGAGLLLQSLQKIRTSVRDSRRMKCCSPPSMWCPQDTTHRARAVSRIDPSSASRRCPAWSQRI